MTPAAQDRLERWYRNVARGSQLYADVCKRRLAAFTKQMRVEPERLAGLPKDDLRRLLEDYLEQEKARKHSGEYIRTTLKAIRSWLAYNDAELPSGLRVPNSRSHPRVERESPVTPEQLRSAMLAANPGQRVVLALMAFSGVRPQVLGSYDGSDGLVLGDIEGAKVRGTSVDFEKVPALVRVRPTSSKAGHAYFTFLSTEGCEYLKQHLEERARAGERLGPDTDIVSPSKSGKRFMTTINVGDRARQALRGAGIETRPYALRSYFFSRCLEAANAGRVSDRYVEFWSGHTGDVTSRHYTTGRPNLPTSMVEDMRAAYKRAEPFLSTVPTKADDEGANRVIRALLLARGMSPAEVEKQDLSSKSEAELVEMFKRLEASSAPGVASIERAFPVNEVAARLEDGWQFVAALNGSMAVLRNRHEGSA